LRFYLKQFLYLYIEHILIKYIMILQKNKNLNKIRAQKKRQHVPLIFFDY